MNKRIDTFEVIAPAYWACYLINGDSDTMSEAELAACDAWFDRQSSDYTSTDITIGDDQESFFGSWFEDWGQAGVTGGDLIEYTLIQRK